MGSKSLSTYFVRFASRLRTAALNETGLAGNNAQPLARTGRGNHVREGANVVGIDASKVESSHPSGAWNHVTSGRAIGASGSDARNVIALRNTGRTANRALWTAIASASTAFLFYRFWKRDRYALTTSETFSPASSLSSSVPSPLPALPFSSVSSPSSASSSSASSQPAMDARFSAFFDRLFFRAFAFDSASRDSFDRLLDDLKTRLSSFPPVVRAAHIPDAPPNDNDESGNNENDVKSVAVLPSSRRFNFIADTVEQTSDAVVNIDVQGGFMASNGSGFIVNEEGVVVTNAHVVRNKLQKVRVKLPDGRSFAGVVTALDTSTDLAAIQLEGVVSKLPIMKLGSSDSVRTGEWVIAMGSPLQLKNTITVGVVSTVHRSSQDLGLNKNIDYIQTDAAITFGNSGGPLVNLDGEAIGVNTIKMAEGISFAIPMDAVKEFLRWAESQSPVVEKSNWNFLNRFKSNESAEAQRRNYIGITMLTLTPAIIMELQSRHPGFPPIRGGIFVHRVIEGSPSEKAGLIAGDIVLGINGKEIRSTNEVYDLVNRESKLNLTILRNQKVEYVNVYPEEIQVR